MQFTPRQQRVPIGGVPVLFPFKPYPSQRAMMAKVNQDQRGELEDRAELEYISLCIGDSESKPGSQRSVGESYREREESGTSLFLSGLGDPAKR